MFVWVQEQGNRVEKKGVFNCFDDEDEGVELDGVSDEGNLFYRFGIWTYKTRAAFDDIRIKPH